MQWFERPKQQARRAALIMSVAAAMLVAGPTAISASDGSSPVLAVPQLMACDITGTLQWTYVLVMSPRGPIPSFGVVMQGTGDCRTTHGSAPISVAGSGGVTPDPSFGPLLSDVAQPCSNAVTGGAPPPGCPEWFFKGVTVTVGAISDTEVWEGTFEPVASGLDMYVSSTGAGAGNGVLFNQIFAHAPPHQGTTKFRLDVARPELVALCPIVFC